MSEIITASGVPVFCAHTRLVEVVKLVPNPKNPNNHPQRQLELLAKIIRAQGWRSPIVVSERSGFVVKGHGRLAAALLLGVEVVPVDFQPYESEATEYADLVADNQIAELSEIDEAGLSGLLDELKGQIDLDLAGFDDLALRDLEAKLNLPDFQQFDETIEQGSGENHSITCPQCSHVFKK